MSLCRQAAPLRLTALGAETFHSHGAVAEPWSTIPRLGESGNSPRAAPTAGRGRTLLVTEKEAGMDLCRAGKAFKE